MIELTNLSHVRLHQETIGLGKHVHPIDTVYLQDHFEFDSSAKHAIRWSHSVEPCAVLRMPLAVLLTLLLGSLVINRCIGLCRFPDPSETCSFLVLVSISNEQLFVHHIPDPHLSMLIHLWSKHPHVLIISTSWEYRIQLNMWEDVLFTHYSRKSQGQALGFVDRHGKCQTDGQLDPLQPAGAHALIQLDTANKDPLTRTDTLPHFGFDRAGGCSPCQPCHFWGPLISTNASLSSPCLSPKPKPAYIIIHDWTHQHFPKKCS